MPATMATLMVVEDDPIIRSVLVELLRDEGYTVVPAADGLAALETLTTAVPDLVLTDTMVP